jgi:hypothetical protein
LHNYSGTTNQLLPIIANHCGPSHSGNLNLTAHPEVNQNNNNLISSFILADSIKNPVPSIYDTWTSKHKRPITINNPATETNNSQSFPNQSLTFSSQPVIKAPTKITQSSKKNTRGPNHNLSARPKINSTLTRTNLPNPNITQIKPDIKKPKLNRAEPDPTQTTNDPGCNQEMEDMEVQGEKKRRREDDKNQVNNEETEHFLTAGPSSQDCRDQ